MLRTFYHITSIQDSANQLSNSIDKNFYTFKLSILSMSFLSTSVLIIRYKNIKQKLSWFSMVCLYLKSGFSEFDSKIQMKKLYKQQFK